MKTAGQMGKQRLVIEMVIDIRTEIDANVRIIEYVVAVTVYHNFLVY